MTTNLLSLYLPQGIRASLFMRDFSTPTFRKGKYQRFCQVNYTLRRRVHKKVHPGLPTGDRDPSSMKYDHRHCCVTFKI